MATTSQESFDPAGTDPRDIQTGADFAKALRLLHNHSGLTFKSAAKCAGLSDSAVNSYTLGQHLPHATGESPKFFRKLLECYGVTETAELDAWMEALRRVAPGSGPRRSDEVVPYPGLRPFTKGESNWFFGRGELSADLLDQLRVQAAGTDRSIVVIGPSGVGKTSLINAGLIPALNEVDLEDKWSIISINLGSEPARTLESKLSESSEPMKQHRLLLVDQLEAIWDRDIGPDERRAFFARLRELSTSDAPPFDFVLMILRSDFYDQALRTPFLAEAVDDRQVLSHFGQGVMRSE